MTKATKTIDPAAAPPAAAAIVSPPAVPATAPNQPATTADDAQPAEPTSESAEPTGESARFDIELFTTAIEALGDEDFEAAHRAVTLEATCRGLCSLGDEEEEEEEELAPTHEHADLRAICRANGLAKCWLDQAGTAHFDATHVEGLDPATLIEINA